ncbi:MAG TPA: nucleotidyltransferase family protein, partial [Candidatus Eremiobacteraceae bacterium]|nr:nucleotidyltransferase family protein [Candidatus Eremiobacteraceae bacterium]
SSPEWAALLQCASPHSDLSILSALLREVSWPALLAEAERHGIISLLASSVARVEQNLAPPEFAQKIQQLHRAQVLAALQMTAELFRLIDQFRDAGLDILLVKGPSLALRAYGDTGARQYGDLDFLVRQKDILRATELMISAGYQPEIPVKALNAQKIPGQYVFVRIAAPLLVELHTERTMRYFPRGLPIEEFFARQQYVSIDGHQIPTLAIEDELILICIHGAKHLWERLSMVADVAAFIDRQTSLDWERAFVTARAVGAERMLDTGLLLASNLLDAALPQNVQARLQSDRSASQLAAKIATWLPSGGQASPGLFSRALYRIRMRGNVVSGLGYLLRLTFSPTQEDWSAGAGKKHDGRFAALRRPVRLAKKYRAGEKS